MAADGGRDSRTQGHAAWPWCRPAAGGVELRLHVQPGARHAGVIGVHGERLKLAVSAPASDGRANEAVLALLAEACGVPRRAVMLVGGAASREKRVRVAGAPDMLADRLARAAGLPTLP